MAGKYSYVSARSYKGEIGTFGFYRKDVGKLCLTTRSLGKLKERIAEEGRKREGNKGGKEREGRKILKKK